jgi:hypothetical protein
MIHLREQYWAVEEADPQHAVISGNTITWVANGAQARGFKVLPAGNWQIVCTSKDIVAGNELGIIDANEFISLLTSKGCDLNKTYLILKKQ